MSDEGERLFTDDETALDQSLWKPERDLRGEAKHAAYAAYWGLHAIPHTQLGVVSLTMTVGGLAWRFNSPLLFVFVGVALAVGVLVLNFRTRWQHDHDVIRQKAAYDERREVAMLAFENAMRAYRVADGPLGAVQKASVEAQFAGVTTAELQVIAKRVDEETGHGDDAG